MAAFSAVPALGVSWCLALTPPRRSHTAQWPVSLGHLSCGSRRIPLLGHLAHAITAGFPSFGGQRTPTVALEPIQALGHTGLKIQGSAQMASVVRPSRLSFLAPHARLTGRSTGRQPATRLAACYSALGSKHASATLIRTAKGGRYH
jgi:hypothetical protein